MSRMGEIMTTLKERRKLFDDAVRRKKKPTRVPLYSNAYTYKIFDANRKLSEALYDYDLMSDIQCKFHERYEYDGYHDLGGRNYLPVLEKLGTQVYFVNDETSSLNYLDTNYMMDEDYDKISKKGFMKYFKEDYVLQKYPSSSKEEIFDKVSSAMKELQVFEAKMGKTINIFSKEYQALFRANRSFYTPVEYLICSMRGMRNLSRDMRKRSDKLREGLDIMWEESKFFDSNDINKEQNSGYNTAYSAGDIDHTCAFDFLTTMCAHTIMNPKQFEKFYWPHLKETLDYIVKTNQTVLLFIEGGILRLADFFDEIPKGHVAVLVETDDIFELKKRLGNNITVVGGFPTELLGRGTKEQCIDHCKKLMDEVAYDGGYIYSEDKLMSFPTDAKSENLKVVTDYFKNSVYK